MGDEGTPVRVYVLDNGGQYSDHELMFVTAEAPIEVMEPLLKTINRERSNYGSHTIAAALDATDVWWKSIRPMSLREYIDRYANWYGDDPQMKAEAEALVRDYL